MSTLDKEVLCLGNLLVFLKNLEGQFHRDRAQTCHLVGDSLQFVLVEVAEHGCGRILTQYGQ